MSVKQTRNDWTIYLLAVLLFSWSFILKRAKADTVGFKFQERKINRRSVVSTSNFTNTSTSLPAGDAFCKDKTWTLYKSRCYKVFSTFEYFSSANKLCIDNGGTLTSIEDIKENILVEKLVTANTRYNEAWIGFRFDSKSNEYAWTDNTKSTFTNWLFERPNKEGLCAQIIPGGVWSNTLCYRKLQFVCERAEVVPVVEDNKTKLIIMVTLPLSCVFIMLIFILYLCFRSHEEMKAMELEEKKISQHFVDVVANNASVAAEKQNIVKEYEEHLKQAAELQKNSDKNEAKYKERRTRSYSSPKGTEKMYRQVTFV